MTSSSLTGSDFVLKTLGPGDYERIIAVWKASGLPHKPLGRDSREQLEKQMELDPDMFLGAFVDDEMVGIIFGSYDSRKGWLNRLAVLPRNRGRGIARALVEEMERRLKSRGFLIIATLIEDGHDASMELFKNAGYRIHKDITYLTKRENNEV